MFYKMVSQESRGLSLTAGSYETAETNRFSESITAKLSILGYKARLEATGC